MVKVPIKPRFSLKEPSYGICMSITTDIFVGTMRYCAMTGKLFTNASINFRFIGHYMSIFGDLRQQDRLESFSGYRLKMNERTLPPRSTKETISSL